MVALALLAVCGAGIDSLLAFAVAQPVPSPAEPENAAAGINRSPPGKAPCGLSVKFKSTTVRATPSGTLILDDGSELVLAGILMPRDQDAGDGTSPWVAADEAFVFLARLTGGQSITIATSGGLERDRFGRHLAHAFVTNADGRQWVQGALLAAGHARVDVLPSRTLCIPEMLESERYARDRETGLWRHGLYRIRPATKTASLMAARGRFQIVEGKIAKVSTVAGITYLNFGSNWRDDFSIGVPSSLAKEHSQWSKTLESLAGQDVRVRGWIERRNGPFIMLAHPDQLEVLETGARYSSKKLRPEAEASGR